MADIVMPRLSDTMEEGTVLRWLKRDGEQLVRGEELVEIETDKATMIYESDQVGVLEIIAAEGSTLAVGETIARVGGAKEPNSGVSSVDTDDEPASEGPASGGARSDTAPASGSHAATASSERARGERRGADGRVKASPLARRIARESGVDLRELTGSGPGGRIVKADVLAPSTAGEGDPASAGASGLSGAVASSGASPSDYAASSGATVRGVITAKGQTTDVELSRTQQTIARRMAESKATIPDFTLQIDVDMEECVKLRAELKRLSHPEAATPHGAPPAGAIPTYNDMVVKACALALHEYPKANGSYRDGGLQLHARVNVGVAVAAEEALVVPTVFDADEKSLGEIARETRTLATRVRDGSITPPELGGGTFTVSNLGMFGVTRFTAIINPPQAAIVSVGSVAIRPVVADGEIVARHTMSVTLACDHRILYGADAANFLARIRELLESPASLTL